VAEKFAQPLFPNGRRTALQAGVYKHVSAGSVLYSAFHLFRYLDEQMSRYNSRKELDDAGRFSLAVSQIVESASPLLG
jgi:hypothetical protein